IARFAPIFAVLASISLVTWENGMMTLSGVRFTFSVRMAWQLSAASISARVAAGRATQRSRWSMRYRMMRRRAAPALAFNLGFSYCARAGMEKRASIIEILLIVIFGDRDIRRSNSCRIRQKFDEIHIASLDSDPQGLNPAY